MTISSKILVKKINIAQDQVGQRIDNFLRKQLPGVPNSLIYKIIRGGQVRVNSGRVKPLYRLKLDDIVRVPPVSIDKKPEKISTQLIKDIKKSIIFENNDFIVLDKPAGIAVHSGSKINYDLISSLRTVKNYSNISLVHRLDKNTSGCLILSKNYHTSSDLGKIFKDNQVAKEYIALLGGDLKSSNFEVNDAISKEKINGLKSMVLSKDGKEAKSMFKINRQFHNSCLVNIIISTGRTHQIRVHSASIDHPVCGDVKYGDSKLNKDLKTFGLKRMFLHSHKISFFYKKLYNFKSELSADLTDVLNNLEYNN